MITTAHSARVRAPRARVWHALTDPAEILGWDAATLAPIGTTEGYPQAGAVVRWRYRLGSVPIVCRDCPLEVSAGERLRSAVALGLFRFERTWSLADAGKGHTRLGLSLASENSLPLVGGALDRFQVRQLAAEYVDEKLGALRAWCESRLRDGAAIPPGSRERPRPADPSPPER